MDHTPYRSRHAAFTLVELLVVIAIIAILSTVAVIVINPAQLLAQSRDGNRIGDMSSLNLALADYQSQIGGSMGSSNIIYVSLPDSSSTCGSWNLPTAPTGYTYQCAPSSTYKSTTGTGWIPLNLSTLTPIPPISVLPVDPKNTSSTGLYYTYSASGTAFEVTSLLESTKYRTQYTQAPVLPDFPGVNARGSSLSLSPLFSPTGLTGYWPLDEGVGSSTVDQSGSGQNGTWSGTATNGSYYTTGMVGSYSGTFNGTNNNIAGFPSPLSIYTAAFRSMCSWIKTSSSTREGIIGARGAGTGGWALNLNQSSKAITYYISGGASLATGAVINTNTPYFVCATQNTASTTVIIYVNGVVQASSTSFTSTEGNPGFTGIIGDEGASANHEFIGQLDDVRAYNRVLSTAEVQAIYNAEK